MTTSFLTVALLVGAAAAINTNPPSPFAQCEFRDGDCPNPCPAGDGLFGATPTLRISAMCGAGLCAPGSAGRLFGGNARAADAVIAAHANATDLVRFDNASTGLHTSVLHTCCHSLAQLAARTQKSRFLPSAEDLQRLFLRHASCGALFSVERPALC